VRHSVVTLEGRPSRSMSFIRFEMSIAEEVAEKLADRS